MQHYVSIFRDLDERREGLDFEINDLLADLDAQAPNEGQDPNTINTNLIASESKVGMLINKVLQRQKEIENQKNKLIEILGSERGSAKNETDPLAGVNELSKLNA